VEEGVLIVVPAENGRTDMAAGFRDACIPQGSMSGKIGSRFTFHAKIREQTIIGGESMFIT
jgi:hypothetical protein